MNRSGTRIWVRGACITAVLAVVAFSLSGLMVAQTPDSSAPRVAPITATLVEVQETGAPSAVSALMAGNAVGQDSVAIIDLRHDASAFVP